MKPHRVVYRRHANADLRRIYEYVLERSADQGIARGFADHIMASGRKLADVPLMGRARDDFRPGLRVVPFERRFVVAYHVELQTVRIFHGGQDYEAILKRQQRD